MLKLLLFDAFRTLFDTYDTHTRAVLMIFETQNITGVDVEEFHKKWDEYIVEKWRAPGAFELQWPIFEECLARTFAHFGVARGDAAAGNRLWLDLVAASQPFPETADVVRPLARQYKTAIVSNSDNFEMEICLSRLDLNFNAVFTSEDVRSYKPRPEIFQAALDHFGVPPDQAVMIGDSLAADVAGAHNAGIRAVWINRTGRALPPGGPRPEFALPDLLGLPDVLKSL